MELGNLPQRRAIPSMAIAFLLCLSAFGEAARASETLPNWLRIGRISIVTDPHALITIDGAEFSLDGSTISVGRVRVRALGGRLSMDPIRLDDTASEATTELWIDGIELADLASLPGVTGLDGKGTFDGHLPLAIDRRSGVRVSDGLLSSRGSGTIRYRPETPLSSADGGVGLLLEALENFHYDRIAITLEGALDREMAVELSIRGRNPDLYGGHPFELNVNLGGALGTVVRQALQAYRLPQLVGDKVGELLR